MRLSVPHPPCAATYPACRPATATPTAGSVERARASRTGACNQGSCCKRLLGQSCGQRTAEYCSNIRLLSFVTPEIDASDRSSRKLSWILPQRPSSDLGVNSRISLAT
eukprot:6194551-Pleurochrysis_carterae.AAC.1